MKDSDSLRVKEIEPADAYRLMTGGVPVFDVRPERERVLGGVRGAEPLDPEDPVASLAERGLGPGDQILVCCRSGNRSLNACGTLAAKGFVRAFSIAGGFNAWRDAGLPCAYPAGMDAGSVERYARHLVLPEVGVEGQARLKRARVLLIGAGGLGSPAALYLAAAGVGRLGVVDDDVVERSNLQRQVLHAEHTIGQPKTESAASSLAALNPDVEVRRHDARLDAGNAEAILAGWDVVVDGSDNLPTRYLTNETCVRLGIPLVYGAVMGFDGQLSVFHPASRPGAHPCYQCLFPEPPSGAVQDCNTAGVLGVLPGMVGVMQACETLKLLLEIGEPLLGRLLLVDAMNMRFRTIRAPADPACRVCGSGP